MPNFFQNLLNGVNLTSKEGFIIIIIIIIYGSNIKKLTSWHGPKNCLDLLKKSDMEDVVGIQNKFDKI